jgi:hypothetical protein
MASPARAAARTLLVRGGLEERVEGVRGGQVAGQLELAERVDGVVERVVELRL